MMANRPDSSILSLTSEQMEHVKQYYLTEIPEFCYLQEQYVKEKTQAKGYHRLKVFPDISE